MSGKNIAAATAEQCLKSAVKQLKSLLKQAEAGGEVNMGAVKELTAVLKELVKLRQAMAQEKEAGGGLEVRVVFDKGVEEMSQ